MRLIGAVLLEQNEMADRQPLHDGRGLRSDRQRGDRPHSQHNHESRLIMPSGHPENYTTLTDVTQNPGALTISAACQNPLAISHFVQ